MITKYKILNQIENKFGFGKKINDFKLKDFIEGKGFKIKTNVLVNNTTESTYEMKIKDSGKTITTLIISSKEGSGTMIEDIA